LTQKSTTNLLDEILKNMLKNIVKNMLFLCHFQH